MLANSATKDSSTLQLPLPTGSSSVSAGFEKSQSNSRPSQLTPQVKKWSMIGTSDRNWGFLAIPSFLTVAYVVLFILDKVATTPGSEDHGLHDRVMGSIQGRSHVFGSITAMATGPFQFLVEFRRKQPALHRWIGRIYVAGIIAGAYGGFSMSSRATCYPIGRTGFHILATSWLITISLAMAAIWRGDVLTHKSWMRRNMVLTWAATILRPQMWIYVEGFGITSHMALTISAYSSWVPSMILSELYSNRKSLFNYKSKSA